MQPDLSIKTTVFRIAKKEILLFFASPIAYLFLATFAAITLFVFFWGESFFARNIADVRPLFEWMPVLLIFLSATLTMRLWSEERRTGTLEHVLTQAVPLWHFVVGKFMGCLFLFVIALMITLPLPVTVAVISDLDWGPVVAGYLATLLIGAAYLSIGLFVSARSDNQIVSLISACVLCGVFYLIGTSTITDLFGNQIGEWLRLIGTGSRFESITRGVIDLRDLYFYLSILLVFLSLNTFVLEKERWAVKKSNSTHNHWRVITGLMVANAVIANFWLGQLNVLRMDTTEGDQYSISEATQNYLQQLQEPLLVRGYFSSKTHPLLSPLVPQLRDLIKEYEVAGKGKVRVEFIDPLAEPEKEEEANQKYAIRPVPFQVADRYQSSIVSSYFNVLVQYGDEHQVLGFRDLIEVKASSESDINVQLRNPEHDLTRAIKKVLQSYQSGGNLFDTVRGELDFTTYVSGDSLLPEKLVEFKRIVEQSVNKVKNQSDGRFKVSFVDPEADGGKVGQQIAQDFGFQPMATGLFSNNRFYFYMTLAKNEQIVQIPLDDMTEASFQRNLEAGIKRFASGFTKTVALFVPQSEQSHSPYAPPKASYGQLEAFLGAELNVQREDLSDGMVSGEADILFLVAPKALDEKQLFAVDQFLMQGGTVIAATSPFNANLDQRGLSLEKRNSGMVDWLKHYGLTIGDELVLDQLNAAFPIPVTRNVGDFQLQEMRMFDYPYFVDVRGEGLNQNSLVTSELPQATLAWASPIQIDSSKQAERQLTELLYSSEASWLSSSMDITPKVDSTGSQPQTAQGRQLLGVVSSGRFDSYFAGKPSPLLAEDKSTNEDANEDSMDGSNPISEPEKTSDVDKSSESQSTDRISSVIERSPESARIILFSSNDFLSDRVIQLTGSASQSEYLNTLQMAANAIDWSLEDTGLLSIRSRGHFNRTLPPMEHEEQLFWEYFNYVLAALALILVMLSERRLRIVRQRRHQEILIY